MRHLASIQTISNIETIPGADSVELATVQGYKTIVQKNQFKIGELVVFFEVDSILPKRPEFAFMEKHKYRVKVMKSPRLGVVSQGLVIPTKDLMITTVTGELLPFDSIAITLPETPYLSLIGCDVTALLNVTKWEPFVETDAMGLAKGTFPSFIPKTDEIRLQSAMGCLEELKGEDIFITEKYDGTSLTAYQLLDSDQFGVCSRNQELKDGDNGYWQVALKYSLPVRLREFCKKMDMSYAIQGELAGGKYGHGNPMCLSCNDLYVFNVYNITEHRYLDYLEFIETTRWLGLKTVTVLFKGKFDHTIEQLEEFAKGLYPGTKNPREGIVIRPTKEKFSKTLMDRLSVKVINQDFALKFER